MRIILFIIMIFVIRNSFSQTTGSNQSNSRNEKEKLNSVINEVENGLLPRNLIKGETGKNIKEQMKFYNVPGVSVTVIKDFKIDWTKSYGVKDFTGNKAVDENTIFQAASISKAITSLVAMKLIEEGLLDLDNDINTYLKDWKIPENQFTKDKIITLRQLLSHTSGILPVGFNGYRITNKIPDLLKILTGEKPSNSRALSVVSDPGSKYQYSGYGYLVIQKAMMDVMNSGFEELMYNKLFHLLGLRNSTFEQNIPQQLKQNLAKASLVNGASIPGGYHIYPELSAAGLWSTSSDLAQMMIALLDSYRGENDNFLSQKTIKDMVSGSNPLGFNVTKKGTNIYIGHSGSNNGYRCNMICNLEKGYGAVVLTNSEMGYQLYNEIIRSIAKTYNWEEYLPKEIETVEQDQNEMQKYAGKYQLNPTNLYYVYERNKNLYIKDLSDNEKKLFPLGNNTFITDSGIEKFRFVADLTNNKITLEVKMYENTDVFYRVADVKDNPVELLLKGKTDEAYQEFITRNKNASGSEVINWEELDVLAYSFLRSTDFIKAKAVFEMNIKLNPENSVCYYGLGDYYLKTGDDKKALEYFNKTKEIFQKFERENEPFQGLLKRTEQQIEMLQN